MSDYEAPGFLPVEWQPALRSVDMGGGTRAQIFGDDSELAVTFYNKKFVDEAATKETNFTKLVRAEKPFCKMQRVGERLFVHDQPVRPDDVRRFPDLYNRFRSGESEKLGTPLEIWEYFVPEGDIMTFRMLGITTVEQIAQMSEHQTYSLGLDQKNIVSRAKLHMAEKEKLASVDALDDRFKEVQRKNEEMQAQLSALLSAKQSVRSEEAEYLEKLAKAPAKRGRKPKSVIQVAA